MNFPFPPLKLPNKGREKYSKMILFISFHSPLPSGALEKAYDRMEWSFVRNVLCSLGFQNATVELILSCISFTSISLLFNGEQLEEFEPSRGLRQGDPIFPYIFILCMELVSSLINKKCEDGDWDKVKASRNGLGFSYMFFYR